MCHYLEPRLKNSFQFECDIELVDCVSLFAFGFVVFIILQYYHSEFLKSVSPSFAVRLLFLTKRIFLLHACLQHGRSEQLRMSALLGGVSPKSLILWVDVVSLQFLFCIRVCFIVSVFPLLPLLSRIHVQEYFRPAVIVVKSRELTRHAAQTWAVPKYLAVRESDKWVEAGPTCKVILPPPPLALSHTIAATFF
jgi:hypothetical protein